jgi:PHD/YefM family antitoxin component YafN of YafNO toxin-antitoxin module
MNNTTFTTSQLQCKIGMVLNTVQQEGLVVVKGRSRPEMVLTMKDEHDALIEKVRQLTKLVKAQ